MDSFLNCVKGFFCCRTRVEVELVPGPSAPPCNQFNSYGFPLPLILDPKRNPIVLGQEIIKFIKIPYTLPRAVPTPEASPELHAMEYINLEFSDSHSFVLPPQRFFKPTLVLDLDHTLVFPTTDIAYKDIADFSSFIPNSCFPRIFFIERPGLKEFLEELSFHYEIVIFTAGIMAYALRVIKKIDKSNAISYVLSRKHCQPLLVSLKSAPENEEMIINAFTKDLSVLGRTLESTIIIDDREQSYLMNPKNGILIPGFYGNKNDTVLIQLKQYLLEIKDLEDLRFRKKMQYK